MSFLQFDFPHGRNYESDITWLIDEYKRLIHQYEELNKKYQELINLKDTLNDAIASIDPKIQEAIAAAMDEVDQKFAELTAQMQAYQRELKAYIDAELERVEANIDGTIKPFSDKVDKIVADMADMQNQMSIFEETVLTQVRAIREQVETLEQTLEDKLTAYIDDAISKWSTELPLIRNPVTGVQASVEDTTLSMYHDYIDRDKTVENVTKGYTDETERIIREDYNNKITTLNNIINERTLFRSPVTGRFDSATNLLLWICEQLKDAYTAREITNMSIPASFISQANITAFEYCWTHWARWAEIPPIVQEIVDAALTVQRVINAKWIINEMIHGRQWLDDTIEGRR